MPSAVATAGVGQKYGSGYGLGSKPDGWKGSWFVHVTGKSTMLENQELEPRTAELIVPAERVDALHRDHPRPDFQSIQYLS